MPTPGEHLNDNYLTNDGPQTNFVRLNTSDDGRTITFQIFVDDSLAEEKCVHEDFVVTIEPWRVTVSGRHISGGDIFWSTDIDDEAFDVVSTDPGSVVVELLEGSSDTSEFVY